MKDLTERQKEILDFIAQFTDDNAYAPTVREICDHFNISIRAVQDHIAALQKKGFLSITRHRSRSMKVMNDRRTKKNAPPVMEIPLVVSGEAENLLDVSNISGSVYRSTSYFEPGKVYFALHVSDDGLRKSGILEGDVAVVEKTESVSEGQVVAAYEGGSIKLRRAVMENGRIIYRADDDTFPPVYGHLARVLGVLVELSRSF